MLEVEPLLAQLCALPPPPDELHGTGWRRHGHVMEKSLLSSQGMPPVLGNGMRVSRHTGVLVSRAHGCKQALEPTEKPAFPF